MRGGPWLRLRAWTRREPQLVTRLIGLGAIEVLTQFNFAASPRRDFWLHSGVTGALAAWALTSVALQAIARRDRGRDPVRLAWAAADVAFLTLILWLFAAAGSPAVGGSMIVGYPVVVAASGLWFRVGLVWLTTALAEAGYGLLVIDARLRGSLWQHDHHPNIVMAAIALAGFVVARQVKRLLALELLLRAQAAELTRRTRTGNSSAPYGYCRRIRGASGAAVLLSMARTTPGVSRKALRSLRRARDRPCSTSKTKSDRRRGRRRPWRGGRSRRSRSCSR